MAGKKTTTTTLPGLANLNSAAAAEEKVLQGLGVGAGTSTTPPAVQDLTAAETTTPVPFSLPSSKAISTQVQGLTNENGTNVTTMGSAMEALYHMTNDQLATLENNLIDSGKLADTTPPPTGQPDAINGKPTSAVITAYKSMITDAVNSGIPLTTLLSSGSGSPQLIDAMKASNTALQQAEDNYAEAKTGQATQTDPNSITQALDAAYASIGVGQPPPGLVDAFIAKFQSNETQDEGAYLGAVKTGEGDAVSQIATAQSDLRAANTTGAAASDLAAGPVIVGAKPTPNLDADAMAQAKASDPGQYYATQSSYLYGLLLNSIRGTPAMQTAPTAPSQSAPGGVNLGAPLVAAGS